MTLHENGELRGCIGYVVAVEPLEETIREMARAAALEDPRFAPVTRGRAGKLQVEISVLSPMFEIAPEDVVVGRHGLMVSYEGRRGLLLPQVAPEWGWDRETLLAQTCRKAGLPTDKWRRGAKLEAFTAEVFGEAEPGESLRESIAQVSRFQGWSKHRGKSRNSGKSRRGRANRARDITRRSTTPRSQKRANVAPEERALQDSDAQVRRKTRDAGCSAMSLLSELRQLWKCRSIWRMRETDGRGGIVRSAGAPRR